ncbi:MAG: DUF1360 domain-containing protein [Actinomycetota bacterium]
MAAPDHAPHGAYAAIMGTFAAGLGGAALLAKLLGREPRENGSLDLIVLSLATFKTARTIARDEVGSFIREPFLEGEDPVESGDVRQAIGELVTCSRCVGTWIAGGLTATQIVAPRFGRVLTWSLAAAGANDVLQAGFAALTSKSNELEERATG